MINEEMFDLSCLSSASTEGIGLFADVVRGCGVVGCGVDCEPGYIRRSRVMVVPCPACQAREVVEKQRIILGDCLDVLRTMDDNSVDAVVTDPPYGLGNREPTAEEIVEYIRGADLDHQGDFMGKDWNIPSVAVWRECFRVLKPGGYLLSFGGSRTWDLISLGIRAAGFEKCEDVASMSAGLAWITGQGFPKSLSISKAIDSAAGAERTEVIGFRHRNVKPFDDDAGWNNNNTTGNYEYTAPATDAAKQWSGWGTSLKPAFEPILVFQKPVEPVTSEEVHRITGWDHWCSDKRVYEHSKRKRLKWAELLAAGYEPITTTANPVLDVEFEVFEEPDAEPQPTGKPYFVLRTKRALHPGAEDQLVLRHAAGEAVLEHGPYKPWKIKGYVGNVLKYGTGGLNIDACRVGASLRPLRIAENHGLVRSSYEGGAATQGGSFAAGTTNAGRWPANLIFSHSDGCERVGEKKVPGHKGYPNGPGGKSHHYSSDKRSAEVRPNAWTSLATDSEGLETIVDYHCVDGCPVKALGEQSGQRPSPWIGNQNINGHKGGLMFGGSEQGHVEIKPEYRDKGTAARFFPQFQPDEPFLYASKASRSEREAGCEHLPGKSGAQAVERVEGSDGTKSPRAGAGRMAKQVHNHHVTVKPLSLMRWLIRLVTRPGQVVLDPFAGSGTTLCAAALEGVKAIGIEREPDYVEIVKARLAHWQKQAP